MKHNENVYKIFDKTNFSEFDYFKYIEVTCNEFSISVKIFVGYFMDEGGL